jgi:hypothetical protein
MGWAELYFRVLPTQLTEQPLGSHQSANKQNTNPRYSWCLDNKGAVDLCK